MTGYIKNIKVQKARLPIINTENVTLNHAMLEFPQYLFREGKSFSTKEAYMNDLNHFKSFMQNDLNNKIRYVNKITLTEIMQYKDHMLLNVNKKDGVAANL